MQRVSYSNVIKSFMYAMMCMRPDICYVVELLRRYQSNPRQKYWIATQRLLTYFKRTANYFLCYQGGNICLVEYIDVDRENDLDK